MILEVSSGVTGERHGKARRRELYCEVARDVGILVFVFAPLDIVLNSRDWSGPWLAALMAGAVAVIIIGVHQDPGSKRR
jgi:hypothetical protein